MVRVRTLIDYIKTYKTVNMNIQHFNLKSMAAYRHNKAKRGYNPFDYPEEWEFFKHPFEADEEDDILTDLLFQIRKMTRRLHLYFDDNDYNRLEAAFYFGLLDSLSEVEDYLLGALKYARYCRLENLFFLSAHEELGNFIEKLSTLSDELFSKIRTFGDSIRELNTECHDGVFFLRQYCDLTKHGIPNNMLRALLRAPNFPFDLEKPLMVDKDTNIWSFLENATIDLTLTEEEQNIEGACDSSKLETTLDPVDNLLWHIRGTLLWVVIKKVIKVCSNVAAIVNRHDKLVENIYQDTYKELCGVYARSQAYARRRDEELPQRCGEFLYLQGRKPTTMEVHTFFNTQYRNLIMTQNQSQLLFHRCRKQENTFYIEFIKLLLNEDTHEDAEDFLFVQTFSKELSVQHMSGKKVSSSTKNETSAEDPSQKSIQILKVDKVIAKELKIDGGRYPHFPELLSVEESTKLYEFLSRERFIDGNKTPLADFNYLMGAANQYTTHNGPKPICWLKNRQMLREMLKRAFATLLNNGTTQKSLADLVQCCFVNKNGVALSLANNNVRQIVKQEMDALDDFFATISRHEQTS